jgi:putative ABC transport system permease protein
MKLRRRVSSSIRPLLTHPVRTLLAVTGIAVGVAAVVVSRSVGDGARREVVRAVESLGTNLLIVKPLPVKRLVMRPEIGGSATTLRREDADAVATLPGVRAVAPAVEDKVRVKAAGKATKTTVRGTTAEYLALRRFELAAGRFLEARDEPDASRVAVLGSRVAQELFAGVDPLGREVRVGAVPFEVIGVLRAKGTTADGADQDNQVLIPLTTALRRVFNVRWLTSAYVGVSEPARMAEAQAGVEELLRMRHRSGEPGRAVDFGVQNTAKTRAFQQEIAASLSGYAAGLAGVALLVGGVGVLALMYLSVRERTGEIGLRMAVGAQPRDVLFQFLIEATALAFAGWVAGIILGGLGVAAVWLGTRWPAGAPLGAMATTLVMALLIGLGFGALPARAAARVPPIEALRK